MTMLLDNLPSDSVLRRHATTERYRILGLPPSDSVLRRHFEQMQAALSAVAIPQPVQAAEEPIRPSAAAPLPAAAPQAANDGGLLGWLRRLLGA